MFIFNICYPKIFLFLMFSMCSKFFSIETGINQVSANQLTFKVLQFPIWYARYQYVVTNSFETMLVQKRWQTKLHICKNDVSAKTSTTKLHICKNDVSAKTPKVERRNFGSWGRGNDPWFNFLIVINISQNYQCLWNKMFFSI